MNKNKYEAPEMKVIKLQPTDVITASTGEFDGEWVMFGSISHKDIGIY